jgi:mitogen-activated protein kinase kinase kinase
VQASAAPSDSLFTGVNPIRGDDVRIGAYLASGAFGRVFCGAWNGEPVALKQIDVEHARSNLPLSEEDIAEALQWEVSRLATTSHPNLVQFHGVCRKDGETYLVLELCEGGSLQRALEKGGIPDSRLWQWMREIADALAYLHGQGMLHRDLKAENVLIDRHGRAKLADLGVAQVDALLEDTEAKAVDMGLQDVAFIAPENLANVKEGSLRQSSKATDIYALGLVFWQMISGGQAPTPWNALLADKEATASMKAGQRMQIPERCPQPIRELILSCWQLKPATRADISELLRQLRNMGPKLHPQAAVIELLEHLESSLHGQRPQARNYVPAQVTAKRIEGRTEDYWPSMNRSRPPPPPPPPPRPLRPQT